MRVKVVNVLIFLGLLFTWHLLFSQFGLYRSRRISSRWEEIKDIAKATVSGTLVIALTAIFLGIEMVSSAFLATFWCVSTGIAVLSRVVLRFSLRLMRMRGRNLRRMLVVGTNPRAVQFTRKIEAKPELGYLLIGFVDEEWSGIKEFQRTGYRLLSDFNGFPGYIREHVVDEVVISLPVRSCYTRISQMTALCEEQGILVRYLSNIFNLKRGQSTVDQFEGDPLITVSTGITKGLPFLVKRMMDVPVSLIFLIVLSPLLLIVSLLIKITSPGPVFFAQERIGLNKRRFRLYKFRTMVPDAEKKLAGLEHLNEVSGPVFKIRDDPRITPIGKFLRKTSIDELPQFINVLKGDMSLVGPRPLPVRDYEGFSEDWHRRRFSVRPGITCLWQVNGRSNIQFEKWMELDLEYIDRWSLGLDFKILLRTLPAVLKGSGAE
jgi:exopolysaccharide biosynthesis polyprenyl glycosylphosphotransferase